MPEKRFVDVHSHMFNGFYVPIEEILNHKFRLDRPNSIALGGILKQMIGKAAPPEFKSEEDWLQHAAHGKDSAQLAELISGVVKKSLRQELEGPNPEAKLSQRIAASELLGHVKNLFKRHHELHPGSMFSLDDFTKRVIKSLIPLHQDPAGEAEREKELDAVFGGKLIEILRLNLENAKGAADFFFKMLVSEQKLFKMLLKNYEETEGHALTVHLMMDIEPAYWTRNPDGHYIPCEYDFVKKQIDISSEFIRKADGKLLGFVAFHPARGEAGIDECFKALYQGHAGIKIYPPLNYRPDGVAVEEGKDYRDVLGKLYTRCEKEQVPIMAHCTATGFEVWEKTGKKSNPKYWENVLGRHGDLRLCLGHAGGGHYKHSDRKGWYADDDKWESKKCFARKVVELCRNYPNVYADFSYLSEIMQVKGQRDRFLANLKREVSTDGKYPLADKIMYGSDWHMPAMIGKTEKFRQMFEELFVEEGFAPDLPEKFFFINAIKFLNMPKVVERHEQGCFFGEKAMQRLRSLKA